MRSIPGRRVAVLTLIAISGLSAGALAALAGPGPATYAAIVLAPAAAWLFYKWAEIPLVLFVFAGFFKTVVPLPVDLTLLLGLVLVVLTTIKLMRHGPTPVPAAVWLFLGLAILVLAGVVNSLAPAYGVEKAIRFASLGSLTVIAGVTLVRGIDSVRRIAWSILGLGVSMGTAAIVLGGNPAVGGRYTAFGSDTIALGRATAYGLVVALVALLHERKHMWWSFPAIVVCAVALLGSGSRGPLLGLALVLVALLVVRIATGRAMPILLALFVALALLGTVLGSGLIPQRSLDRIETRISFDARTADPTRVMLYTQALELWKRQPVFGTGTGSFDSFGTGYDYPHNIVLEVGSENGIVGVGMLLGFIGLSLATVAVRAIREGTFEAEVLLALGVLGFANALVSSDINGHRIMYLVLAISAAFPLFAPKVERAEASQSLRGPIRPQRIELSRTPATTGTGLGLSGHSRPLPLTVEPGRFVMAARGSTIPQPRSCEAVDTSPYVLRRDGESASRSMPAAP